MIFGTVDDRILVDLRLKVATSCVEYRCDRIAGAITLDPRNTNYLNGFAFGPLAIDFPANGNMMQGTFGFGFPYSEASILEWLYTDAAVKVATISSVLGSPVTLRIKFEDRTQVNRMFDRNAYVDPWNNAQTRHYLPEPNLADMTFAGSLFLLGLACVVGKRASRD